MAQRIAFATLPNTPPIGWHAALVPMLAEIDRSKPGTKALREWMRLRSLFDKEGFETLAAFLDVHPGEPVTLGPVARALLDADDEPAARKVLGDRLIRENLLLAKYCLEALDAEKGGRLHSTNELYRMVTSYVYPGDKPTLNAFKAWVDWAVSAGLLKMVGIRWALGDAGREVLPRLRAIDTEEFLEDERGVAGEGGAGEAPPEAGGGPSRAAEAGAEATEAPGEAPATAASGPAGGEEPQAPADEPVVAKTAPVPPRPPAPAKAVPVSAPSRPAVPATGLSGTRDVLKEWHARWPHRAPPMAEGASLADGPEGLFEAAVLALWIGRGMRPVEAVRVLGVLRRNGLLAEAGLGTLTLQGLAGLAGDSDPAVAEALEVAAFLPRLHAATRERTLLHAAGPGELLDRLHQRLYAPRAPMAAFVLARLLWEAGRLPEALAAAAFVPTWEARENAFRIGFLDRLHAASFADLRDASLALAAGFGPPDFEGPLARVHEVYGCAFRCGRARECPLACRERAEVTAGTRH